MRIERWLGLCENKGADRAAVKGGLDMDKTICELFAGVGGFRLGFERLNAGWETVWFSQWEPGARTQWAHDCYVRHFGDSLDLRQEFHTGEDIGMVDKHTIPNHTLLVGGFPCQDYSVAHALGSARGIEGKKGVLWWQIIDTIQAKKPPFCLFENVDRLLKSPAKQRGRDFGVMLACLSAEGYSAEWRVVNAAQYGAAQRRRRVFVFAYRNDTAYGKRMAKVPAESILATDGLMAKAFAVRGMGQKFETNLCDAIADVSDSFTFAFENAGCMHQGKIHTAKVAEAEENPVPLGAILQKNVDEKFYAPISQKFEKWDYLKGAKRIPRKSANGHEYTFSEGPIAFPDPWDRPGRTMLTSEATLNRSTHVVADPGTGRLRLITPVEAERLQGFDDEWTNTGMPERMRYFCMGNALVVPMVTRMGKVLDAIIEEENHPETKKRERLYVEESRYATKEAVLRRGQEIKGIPLGQIDETGRLATGKGGIGTLIEENWFDYKPNPKPEPDFPEAGVELKVTPYVRGKNGIRAKERLVCNIIDYMQEYNKTFRTSGFWHKCNTMLLMSYEHLAGRPKSDFKIDEVVLFQFPEEDLAIIEHDWRTIMEKVRQGRAHELSEGDTLYLAACTKGANASSVRPQPFSNIPAKQRAYSLKASYMTQILNRYIFGQEENPRIIKSVDALQNKTFEEYIVDKVKPYYGMTQNALKAHFAVGSRAKSLNEILLARMLGVRGRIAETEEFKKAGIVPKTIRVKANGTIQENMSFPAFDFIQLSRETLWEDSELYHYLAPARFMFVIFQECADGEYAFDRVMFWNIPNEDLEEVRHVWEKTIQTLREGVKLVQTTRGVSNNLPKQTGNRVAHVRPHGKSAADKLPLPDGRMMTKQGFWLNREYIAEQIKK